MKVLRKRVGVRQAIKGKLHLNDRAVAVLETLAKHYGGPVSTAQLALLHWPPDLAKMLAWFRLEPPIVSTLLDQYSAAHLAERVALGHFLRQLAKQAPEQLATLPPLWQQAQRFASPTWLRQAIDSDVALPAVFVNRPRHPSELVSSKAKVGLRQLFDAGLITMDTERVRARSGSGQSLWYLTPAGRRRLAIELGVTVQDIPYRRPGELSDFTLAHHLQCVDLQISVERACQRHQYTLIKELCDEDLKRLLEAHQVTYKMRRNPQDPESAEELRGMTSPDYFFIASAGGKLFAQFLEVDRAKITVRNTKPGLRDFRRRISILSAMYKSRLYHQLFPEAGNSFRYIVITNGGTDATGVFNRVDSLRQVAVDAVAEISESERERVTGLQRYWMGQWDAVKPSVTDYFSYETILSAAVFQQAGDHQLRPLIW